MRSNATDIIILNWNLGVSYCILEDIKTNDIMKHLYFKKNQDFFKMLFLAIISLIFSLSAYESVSNYVYYNVKYGDTMASLTNNNKTVADLVFKANPNITANLTGILSIPLNLVSTMNFCPPKYNQYYNKTFLSVPYILQSGQNTTTISANTNKTTAGSLLTGLIIVNGWQCPAMRTEGYLVCIPKDLYSLYNLKNGTSLSG